MPAPPVAAPATRAPDHLDPLLALATRTSAVDKSKPAYQDDRIGMTDASDAHSVAMTECASEVLMTHMSSLRYRLSN